MNRVKNEQVIVILAAGGNPTGIICFPDMSHRGEYTNLAKDAMSRDPAIEQFGFLEGEKSFHLQMSGGEFCGNAARAAALLISEMAGQVSGKFTISGFDGEVSFQIVSKSSNGGVVECQFPGLRMNATRVEFMDTHADVVDMGGIVHVVMQLGSPFNNQPSWYERIHREVVSALGLGDRAAVGVVWREEQDDNVVAIHPVVWVKGINSFFYESACGSGTLATLAVSNSRSMDILQPSGQCIHAEKVTVGGKDAYLLRSEVQKKRRDGVT